MQSKNDYCFKAATKSLEKGCQSLTIKQEKKIQCKQYISYITSILDTYSTRNKRLIYLTVDALQLTLCELATASIPIPLICREAAQGGDVDAEDCIRLRNFIYLRQTASNYIHKHILVGLQIFLRHGRLTVVSSICIFLTLYVYYFNIATVACRLLSRRRVDVPGIAIPFGPRYAKIPSTLVYFCSACLERSITLITELLEQLHRNISVHQLRHFQLLREQQRSLIEWRREEISTLEAIRQSQSDLWILFENHVNDAQTRTTREIFNLMDMVVSIQQAAETVLETQEQLQQDIVDWSKEQLDDLGVYFKESTREAC